jgi:hypothetical protein
MESELWRTVQQQCLDQGDKKRLLFQAVFSDVLRDRSYFFLCTAQKTDFPTAPFLHFVPCFVLPAHIAFFAVAMSTPFC